MDEIMQKLAALPEEERLKAVEEAFAARGTLKEIKAAWQRLGIRGGASAGTRTGLIGPFVDEVEQGETMQVDRDAYREFTGLVNRIS